MSFKKWITICLIFFCIVGISSQDSSLNETVIVTGEQSFNFTSIQPTNSTTQAQVAQSQLSPNNQTSESIESNSTQANQPTPPALPQNNQPQQKDQSEQQKLIDRQENILRAREQHNEMMASQKVGDLNQQQRQQFQKKLAVQSRIAYQRVLKQLQQQRQRQAQQMQRLTEENKLTKTEDIKYKESQQFKRVLADKFVTNREYNKYNFDLQGQQAQDFRISIPTDQFIMFAITIYSMNDGIFSIPVDIQNEGPLWLYVYQNNSKIVYQNSLYFKLAYSFQGKANTTYLFRFTNHGTHKLIAFNLVSLIEQNHVYDILTVEDIANHSQRIGKIRSQMTNKMFFLDGRMSLESQNKRKLTIGISHYFFYTIGEIVLIGIICFIQVEFVQKLLVKTSVV